MSEKHESETNKQTWHSRHQRAEDLPSYSPERWQERYTAGALAFIARGSGRVHDDLGNGCGVGEWRVWVCLQGAGPAPEALLGVSFGWEDDIGKSAQHESLGGMALDANGCEKLATAATHAAAVMRAGDWVDRSELRQLDVTLVERDEARGERDLAHAAHQETLRQLAEVTAELSGLKYLVARYLRVRDKPETDLAAVLQQEIEREDKGEWMPTYHDWVAERCKAADRAEEARAAMRLADEVTAERDALAAHAERLTEAMSREDLRDPLRARVEELEAERDALKRTLEVSFDARDMLKRLNDDFQRENNALDKERRALKRRVEELEAAIHLDERLSLLSEKAELERMLADTPDDDRIGRASLGARLRKVAAQIAALPPRAAQGG